MRLTVGGTLLVNGRLSANGKTGLQDNAGGGSGGSLWLTAGALTGTGTITADGGDGELFDGGGGGGGRIAIYSPLNVFAGVVSAEGGDGAFAGQPGSIFATTWAVVQGSVTDTNGLPVSGVLLQADSGVPATATDANGNYALAVPPMGTVTVTPMKANLTFVPSSRTYASVTAPIVNGDYLAATTVLPAFTTRVRANNYMLNWYGIAGVTYQTLYSTNLLDWLPYGLPVAGTNGPTQWSVPIGTAPSMFFRVGASY